jgi:hypothetical protein
MHTMEKKLLFVGLDVHAKNITIALAEIGEDSRGEARRKSKPQREPTCRRRATVTPPRACPTSATFEVMAMPLLPRRTPLSSNRTRGDTRTETRSMKLSISNVSAAAVDVKIRYLFVGRDLAVRSDIPKGMCGVGMMSVIWPPRADAVLAGKGEQAATVKSGSAIIVETPAATAVSTPPRLVNGRLEKGRGNKFLGYAVRVYRGTEVLAEVCEPGEFARWAFFQQPFLK